MTTPLDTNYIRVGPLSLIQDILEFYTNQPLAGVFMHMEMEHRLMFGYQKPWSKEYAIATICGEVGISIQIYKDPVPTIEITLS